MLSDKETEEIESLRKRVKQLEEFECPDCHHQSKSCGGDYVNVYDYEGAGF